MGKKEQVELFDKTMLIAEITDEVKCSGAGNIPCPFCGKNKLAKIISKKEPKHGFIYCDTCGASGPTKDLENLELLWNTRAFGNEIFIRPQDVDKIATLEIKNKELENE